MNLIQRLQEQREALRARLEQLLDTAEARAEGERNLTEEENRGFEGLRDEILTLDERIAELLSQENRAREAREGAERLGLPNPATGVSVRSEPLTYQRGNPSNSYFRDVGLNAVNRADGEARERLAHHRREMDVEVPHREARQQAQFDRGLESLSVEDRQAAYERRDISRVDGAGGEFVPPLWLLDEYAGLARAGRPFLELLRNIPLPAGTDSINIPRITTGTAVAAQTADNAAVAETDMVTNSVACPVRTYAGQQDLSLQLLEQSPIMFDELVFADLQADYNAKVDADAINGSGAAGTILGILNVAGIAAVAYTDGTPTVPELYPKAADALSQASTARKRTPNVYVLAPRRWFWMLAALDSSNRPLVVPSAQGPFNSLASVRDLAFEGAVGTLLGTPVVLDPNSPITLGAGTNEDRLIATLSTDHVLFEGSMRTRALPEVLSGTLTVRLQLYRYIAFTAGRFPQATATVGGTGTITPTF